MQCRITDLRYKEVINVRDGSCLGCVSDIEVDTVTAKVVSVIIYGRRRCFGLLGKEEDTLIPWCDIAIIGEDTILVNMPPETIQRKGGAKGLFAKLFG